MCGILFARIKNNDNEDMPGVFQDALKLMQYRGTDNTGFLQIQNNYYGHIRLSIIDFSEHSNQPMHDEKFVMLFSGEIYNYKDINSQSSSDTLALFSLLQKGHEIPAVLNGMYTVLISDIMKNEVKIHRDFYGEKPLYYYDDPNIFIASSTIQSILYILKEKYGLKLAIDRASLAEYMLFGYIREPGTIYSNIQVLPSAHTLTLTEKNTVQLNSNVSEISGNQSITLDDYARKCLSSTDVESTLLLSSGVDSTYLLSLMQDIEQPYSVLMYGSPNNKEDESRIAVNNLRIICKDKMPKLTITDNWQDMLALYSDYVKILEQPTNDGINLYNILRNYRAISNNNRLILSGLGGDELLGGYNSFINYHRYKALMMGKFAKKYLPKKYQRFLVLSKKYTRDYTVAAYYFQYRICPVVCSFIDSEMLSSLFERFIMQMKPYLGIGHHDSFDRELKTYETMDYMKNQLLRDSDNISMAIGYESRNPMLNLHGFNEKPDNKQKIKSTLYQNYNIKFKSKRGFKLHEDSDVLSDFFLETICHYNKQYKLLSDNFIMHLKLNQKKCFGVLKKFYILFGWLTSHSIAPDDVQGVVI